MQKLAWQLAYFIKADDKGNRENSRNSHSIFTFINFLSANNLLSQRPRLWLEMIL